jgi:glyoxylate reductase
MKPMIFATRRIPQAGLELLKGKFDLVVREKDTPPTKEELIKGFSDADGAITLLTDKVDAQVLEKAKKLKIIAHYAAGYDSLDVAQATKMGICVTNTPGALTETTADLAFALLLSVARRIPESDDFVRKKKWKQAWHPSLMLGADVHGKTIGVVGMGRIGIEVAKRAKGFGMKVLYSSESINFEAETLGARQVELEKLLRESDFVSLHVPLTQKTKGLIGVKQLEMMRNSAILINTSRGSVVDQKALAKALKKGTISGAGLDVFEKEPIDAKDELLKLKNAVIVPHIGSATTETRDKMAITVAENLLAYFSGKKPPQLVNGEAWKS